MTGTDDPAQPASDLAFMREAVTGLPAYRFEHHPQPIKLDQNEAPDDLAPAVLDVAIERMRSAKYNRYPDLHPVALEEELARRHDWPAEGVVVANGSNVLIQALVILAGVGRSVVTVSPTFAVYAAQARLLGAETVEVPLAAGNALPTEGLVAALRGRRGALFLTDPAAPTGNAHDPLSIERVLTAAHGSGEWLGVIDEAYCEFAGSDHQELVRRLPSTLSLRTFSKAAGLAGVRLGYALTSPEVATNLRKVLLPFSVSALQVAVGLSVLERPDLRAARIAATLGERDRVVAAMRLIPGVEVFPSVTNFVLFRVNDPAAVHGALLAAGVVIRRQDHLPGAAGCLRVSIGAPGENDAFLAALRGATEHQASAS